MGITANPAVAEPIQPGTTERPAGTVRVSEKGERALRGGYVFVFDGDVTAVEPAPDAGEDSPQDGDLVTVRDAKGRFLGTGFWNSRSRMRVRLVSRNANDTFTDAFWNRRLRYALDYRKSVMGEEDLAACRLIFSEADGLPGLIADRFEDVLSVQVLSLGAERRLDRLLPALVTILREDWGQVIRTVYLRCDGAVREREGLTRFTGCYTYPGLSLRSEAEDPGTVEITENGIRYTVDYREGQKTGFFLDQKYNRRAIRNIARGRRVLDCFTHTGSFGLNAAAAGALEVESVDISAAALEVAAANARRNGLSDRIRYTEADAFDYLRALGERGRRACPFDFIILDPPALTKTRDTLKNAIRGYRDINTAAMRALPRGGYLATCSCSHFMTDTNFLQMLHNSAEDAGVSLRQIELRKQAPDHPILWNVPETDYLVFGIFQIV